MGCSSNKAEAPEQQQQQQHGQSYGGVPTPHRAGESTGTGSGGVRSLRTTNSERSRELPLIPESAATVVSGQEDVGSICSMTTVATPASLPLSHLDSVAYSTVSAQIDRDSLAGGRSLGPLSLCGTTAYNEDDSKSTGAVSAAESRFDSQNYLQDLDKLVADDRHACREAFSGLRPNPNATHL